MGRGIGYLGSGYREGVGYPKGRVAYTLPPPNHKSEICIYWNDFFVSLFSHLLSRNLTILSILLFSEFSLNKSLAELGASATQDHQQRRTLWEGTFGCAPLDEPKYSQFHVFGLFVLFCFLENHTSSPLQGLRPYRESWIRA